MPKISVPAETMKDVWGLPHDPDPSLVEDLRNQLVGRSRWSLRYELVFLLKETGKIYRTTYSEAATESQDERPWEYVDSVVLEEVEPYEKTITDFRPTPD